jgi:hypothetical protein
MLRTVSSAVLFAVVLAAVLITGIACANEVRVLEESDTEIVIELATDDYTLEDVVHGGELFVRVVARGLEHTTEPGLPALPAQGVLVGVPFGAELSLDVVSFESEDLGVLMVEPAPRGSFIEHDGFTSAVEDYEADRDYYRGGSTHPAAVVQLGFDTTLRHQRVVQILLHPFQYSPSTGRLTLHRSITVRLRFRGRGRPAGLTDVHAYEAEWEQLYAGTVLNYDKAREWRLRPEPTRAWKRAEMRQEHEAYKLAIIDPGITRLGFSDLSAEGLSGILETDEIAVYQRSYDENAGDPFVETPTPILVFDEDENGLFDGSDYLLFYAQSFEEQYMPFGYEDRYTDENVYWFGWGEELAERMGTRPAWHGWTGLTPPASFRETVKFEEDLHFTRSPGSDEVDFYQWTDTYSSGDDYELSFRIYDMNYSEDARVRARYQGIANSGHSITISIIDGNSVEHEPWSYSFFGITTTMENHIFDVASVPVTYFTDGENTFRTRGTTGSSGANLDWFEITYGRRYIARDGRLRFTSGGETGDIELEVTEFSSNGMCLFDVTDPWDPIVFTLSPENIIDAGGSYTLVLQDQVTELARYEVVENGSYCTPEGIERREPANLLEQEADLIVISYEAFSSGVEPLIAHRESEGHVITHALLHDVYDEFFGGLVGPQAFKNYFKYAFYEWNRQPQFALLVGDASEDTRGLLSTSSPNYLPTYIVSLASNTDLIGSDEWMVSFVDETPYLPDMYIGRLPVGSSGQLGSLISRILTYENASSAGADWRNRILFVADDVWSYGDDFNEYTKKESSEGKFTSESIVMAETVAASPAGMDTVMFMLRRYTDPFHGDLTEDDFYNTMLFVEAEVTPVLLDALTASALVVNFQGHANKHVLTHERLLVDKSQGDHFDSIENDGKPFIFFGFACSIARFFDYYEGYSGYDSFAEQLLFLDEGRGAVASFASTGLEYLTPNIRYNKKIFEAMFTDPTPTGPPEEYFWPRWSLGGILGKAAVKYATSGGSGVAAMRFVLLGDPLLHFEASPPVIQVAVDGVPHASGDYLESSAGEVVQIVADIIDEVEIDPATISVSESDLGEIDPELYLVESVSDTGTQQSRWYRLTYTTEIRDWSYDIRMSASDVNGQRATFTLHVAEGNRILIRDVANHPNPFDRTTSIIYLLNQSGAEVEVRIYTVAGRLIQVFEDAPSDLNYNALVWDGTDREGDTVANGVYLYTIEAKSGDGSCAMTPVGRMVKMR